MDYNNIDSRLRRLYHSVGAIFIEKHADQVRFSDEIDSKSGLRNIKVITGPADVDKVETKIAAVISNLGDMKDNLRKRMVALGLLPSLVNEEIKGNISLRIVSDVDNLIKHGSPLTNPLTNYNPEIVNVRSSIRVMGVANNEGVAHNNDWIAPSNEIEKEIADFIENQGLSVEARLTFDLANGNHSYAHGNNTKLIISADIIDDKGNLIVELDHLVDDSLLAWETFINKHRLSESGLSQKKP